MNATPRTTTTPIPTLGVPSAPPLPEDLQALLRRLRLPHIRAHPPRSSPPPRPNAGNRSRSSKPCSPTRPPDGNAPPWPPAAPLQASPPGRPSRRGHRRRRPRSPPRPSRPYAPWNGFTAGRTSSCAAPPGPVRRSCSRPSASTPSNTASRSPGSPSRTSGSCCAATEPTTPSPRPSPGSCEQTSSSSTTSDCSPGAADAAEGLYRLVDAAYEKRSVALFSNLHPTGQNSWPSPGRLYDRPRADLMALDSLRVVDVRIRRRSKPPVRWTGSRLG